MKRTVALVLALAVALGLGAAAAQDKVYRIGIAQFAVHGSLDNCRTGFIEGLREAGFEEGRNLEIDYQNAQADMGLAAGIASAFVDNQYDMIVAIATPMAVVAHKTADGRTPVIYTAVSAPVEAGLATEEGLGEGNTTGTSDKLPVRRQLETIRAMQPNAKVIGILYTLSETNSQVQLKEYQALAGEYGFTVEASGVSAGQDIALALPVLLNKVDLLTMLLDNTVVQYLDTVLDAADGRKIPVYGSEIEQVRRGCAAAEGLDYVTLGRRTGAMAARVLQGEDAGSIPFERFEESQLYYNAAQMEALGLQLSDELAARGEQVSQ